MVVQYGRVLIFGGAVRLMWSMDPRDVRQMLDPQTEVVLDASELRRHIRSTVTVRPGAG